MFKFIKQIFVSTLMLFASLSSVNPLECVSINNQECKVRPEIVNVNSKEPLFYPFSIKTSKCSGSCNNINDPYAKLCVPDVVKSLNIKVFNLMSITNETRQIEWHVTCKCKCRLDLSVSKNKQCWNEDKCRCECKELIDKGICDKGFIWNPSNCECECDKSCDIGECLDYQNCKCRKKLVDKLVEECTENIEETKLVEKTSAKNENKHKCSSCRLYIVLFSLIFTINVGVDIYFTYSYCYLKKIFQLLSLILALRQQFIELINGGSQRNKHKKSNMT